jgi:mRNA-degrading endonuclease RelE of RelBE toxin-antitoxin system
MRPVAGRYSVEVDPQALQDLEELRASDARTIVDAMRVLRYEAEVPSRYRKPLRTSIAAVPDATWELPIGDYRALYQVRKDLTVRVLPVILKGRRAIDEAAGSRHGE